MKIACPACAAKYSIADEKVKDRLAKIRCRKCGSTIVIDGKVDPPQVRTPEEDSPAHAGGIEAGTPDGDYSVDFGDNDQRSMSLAQIVEGYNDGTLTADTYVWREGMDDWAALADVPEVSQALHAAAADAARHGAGAVEPALDSRAGDMFGGIETAGGEHDMTSNPPGPPVAAPAAATGARNESSVLFSLSSLTSTETVSVRPGAETKTATSEDSGLIDLSALTDSAEEAPSRGLGLGLGSMSVSPLAGSASPLGAPVSAPVPMPVVAPSSNKNGILIGGGIAVAAIVAAIAFVATSGSGPAPEAAAPAPAVTAAPTAVAQPAEAKPAEEETKPSEEESADTKPSDSEGTEAVAAAKPASAPVTRRPRPNSTASKPAAQPAPAKPAAAPAPAPAPAPKKKAKSCNCKPSDLMCAMKCSAR